MRNAENVLKIDPVSETNDETIISSNAVKSTSKLENESERLLSSPNKVDIERHWSINRVKLFRRGSSQILLTAHRLTT